MFDVPRSSLVSGVICPYILDRFGVFDVPWLWTDAPWCKSCSVQWKGDVHMICVLQLFIWYLSTVSVCLQHSKAEGAVLSERSRQY